VVLVRRLRIAVPVAVCALSVALTAAPAEAHTISGPRPSNFRTRIVETIPQIPGISVRVVDLGSRIQLTNRTATDVVVLGYIGEPYLRIGPSGVYENLHSQATYVNKGRNGGSVPPGVDTSPTAKPEWKKISSGHSARWHDHRIHWMGGGLPPIVAQAPGSFHDLSEQHIVFLWGTTRAAVVVQLAWVPGPSGVPWIPVMVVLFGLGLAIVLAGRWRRTLAVALAVLVVVDVLHAVTYEIPRPGTNLAKVVQFLGGSFVSIAVWIVAVITIIAIWRRRVEALYGVMFVGLLVALVGGATDLSSLWKSQLPNAGPHWLTRALVAVALGLGAGLAAGALVRMIRTGRSESGRKSSQWLSLLVVGLRDDELERIARDLDADEVLEVAYAELATRLQPASADLGDDALVVVVTTDAPADASEHIWSIARGDRDALAATRGRREPVRAELHSSFAVMLQVLAGTVPLADALDRGQVQGDGDLDVVRRYAPLFAETAPLDDGVSAAPGAGVSAS